MLPIEQLKYELMYDIQIGYAMFSDINVALQRAYDNRQFKVLDIITGFPIMHAAIVGVEEILALWDLPQKEFDDIHEIFDSVKFILRKEEEYRSGRKNDD